RVPEVRDRLALRQESDDDDVAVVQLVIAGIALLHDVVLRVLGITVKLRKRPRNHSLVPVTAVAILTGRAEEVEARRRQLPASELEIPTNGGVATSLVGRRRLHVDDPILVTMQSRVDVRTSTCWITLISHRGPCPSSGTAVCITHPVVAVIHPKGSVPMGIDVARGI